MEPLIVEFDVAAPIDTAFEVWTAKADSWWPTSHTVTRDGEADIIFEGEPGGRIFERARDGTEHDWGEIIVWEPPAKVAYAWYLFFDPTEATEVSVSFTASESGTTAIRIEQTGWEQLGEQGAPRRAKTYSAWSTITARFQESFLWLG